MKTSPHVPITDRFFTFALIALFQVLLSSAAPALGAEGPTDRPVYQLTEVQKPPVLKREPRIRFSREQRRKNDEITLRFVVTAKGKTSQLTVVKFSDPEMVALAFKVYESVEYIPAIKDGEPVDSWLEVTEVAK